ncbi:flippase-like domain-containing protein [uncultured Actinomyces sp.]|uniref:flippase-like domain-containing protein n=1 Tax=uncultured Actinomyces sp. TaxID=249061 RepID=UPI0028E7CD0A|nr:flippase-like domain-containing protein [uncultured Actinomyces sp.]
MRKRKESHDNPPVVDTNILFVPSSAEDPSSLGVDDLMGMINGAGTTTTPAQKPDVPGPEDKTEILDPIVVPPTAAPSPNTPPSFPPTAAIVPESAIISPVVTVNALQSPAPPPPASAIVDAPPPPLPDDEEATTPRGPVLPPPLPDDEEATTPRGPVLPPPLPDDEEAARPSGPVLPPPAPEADSGERALTEPPAPEPPAPEPPAPEQAGPSAATNEAFEASATSADQTTVAAVPTLVTVAASAAANTARTRKTTHASHDGATTDHAPTPTDSPAEKDTADAQATPASDTVVRAKNGEVALPVPARRLRLPRPAYIADRIFTIQRRREDVVDIVISILAILIIWTIGTVASATTRGVTMDVLQFQLIRQILILPVNLVEGLIILITPIMVIISLALRKRLHTIIQVIVTSVVAAVGGWIIAILTGLLPAYLTIPLSVDRLIATQGHRSGFVIAINLVLVTLCAMFTSAGEAQSMRAIRWGWIGVWVILILGVLRSSMTLPVAFISVFLGRAFGSGSRWIMGYDDQRAKGVTLVEALLGIGITPSRIVRTDLDTTIEPLSTWAVAENARGRLTQVPADLGDIGITITRRPDPDHNRHYQVWSDTGLTYELIVMDPGQELTGTLLEMWNNLRLRGISRWVSPSLKAQAERSSFTTLQALRAGVFTQEPIAIASANDSIIMVLSALPPTTPLTELGERASDEVLDRAWEQLRYAHTRGISHRALTPEAVVVDASSDVWLLDWDSGEVATTELNQSIDIAQMLVLTALAVGPQRALEAGRRCVGDETLIACAPVIQKPVLPASVNQMLRRSDLLSDLRAALVGDSEAESAPTADLQRFRPRTILTIAVAFIAVFIVVSSLNFNDLVSTVKSANPWWMAASAALACLIWVGSAVPLMALSPEKLRFGDTLIAQVAASIITVVAPAGVGPAALNLRYLRKRRVPTAAAVTTVTLMQISQALITIILLLLVMVSAGSSLSVSLPYGTILAVVAVVMLAVGVIMAVPKVRRWIWAKIEPTWQQVYPRLLWIIGQPRRLAAVVAGNLLMNIGYVGAFWTAMVAMGGSLNFSTVAITYLTANAAGSFIPSPGGIGTVETALTSGLTVAGVSSSVAIATALLYRLVTFYGRIPFGWLAMKYMERKDLI